MLYFVASLRVFLARVGQRWLFSIPVELDCLLIEVPIKIKLFRCNEILLFIYDHVQAKLRMLLETQYTSTCVLDVAPIKKVHQSCLIFLLKL
jgi:hypothetical protein